MKKEDKEDKEALKEALDSKYEWKGGEIEVGTKSYFVAVHGPSKKEYKTYKQATTDYAAAKMGQGKYKGPSLYEVEEDLVNSCLITDIPGCATHDDLREICVKKPGIISSLADAAIKLAEVEDNFLGN